MKKSIVLLISIVVFLLFGYFFVTENFFYPSYFRPIVQVLETSWKREGIEWEGVRVIRDATSDPQLTNGASQKNGIFKCYIYEDEKYYTFDLNKQFEGTEQCLWNWDTAYISRRQEGEKTYACWYDFDKDGVRKPDLVFIQFTTDTPGDYQADLYSFKPDEEFGWYIDCYKLGDNIYVMGKDYNSDNRLVGINVNSRHYYYFKKELVYLNNYVKEKKLDVNSISNFCVILQQEDVTVFAADIRDGNDAPATGIVLMAIKEGKPIAYMSVDFRPEEMRDGIEVKILK